MVAIAAMGRQTVDMMECKISIRESEFAIADNSVEVTGNEVNDICYNFG